MITLIFNSTTLAQPLKSIA